MELIVMVDATRRASARRITAVILGRLSTAKIVAVRSARVPITVKLKQK